MKKRKIRVLILGGGFAGVYCARKLEKLAARSAGAAMEVSLVSRENFIVFTPMLPQVVSGAIESNHVVVPIRQVLKRTKFYEADVESIDAWNRRAILGLPDGGKVVAEYDQLVVALGSDAASLARTPSGVEQGTPPVFALKSLKDALVLRNHVIDMLERADIEPDPAKKRQMLTFVVVGGGLSGSETAGELCSFFREAAKYYPNIRDGGGTGHGISLVLVHSRDRLLPELDSDLAEFTRRELEKGGVVVHLNSRVTGAAAAGHVRIKAEDGPEFSMPAGTVVWTTGVSPSPTVADIFCHSRPESGRLPVDGNLRVEGYSDVWAIGDCAHVADGRCPPTAQHAIREAELAAENIARAAAGRPLKEFSYAAKGQMAVIGDRKAIARISGVKIHGFAAWLLWRAVYLHKLPMLKKRLRVTFDWTINVFFDRDLTHIRGFKDESKNPAEKTDIERREKRRRSLQAH
ncbi:NAD(P)/FAD-dependent oxidoreductase [Nitrososphaera sp.]|uniref:NAD(P)/FAD-dependent oxidoreductase n=1 Tax=Nitrososphaera sp. TaxID=1971748 RepID=UPI00307D2A62